MADKLQCKNKGAALAILDTLAGACPRRTQRDAILAVREWFVENFPPEFSEEAAARLQKIFEGDEADKLGRAWYARECTAVGGKLVPNAAPAHGARVCCLWNSKSKKWEPETMPGIMEKRKALKDESGEG